MSTVTDMLDFVRPCRHQWDDGKVVRCTHCGAVRSPRLLPDNHHEKPRRPIAPAYYELIRLGT